ncbi:unnamed protein product [Mytilus coruscus]|uniref:Uncharacterized protein n=1 Tax=Mytilus coruscus TaxID=42192 RepID=A0A6J8A2Y3_MYTCO|nr:unnamed protein product [Mytilus coruscus]
MLISYGFVKDHVKEKHIIIPGLKPYLSYFQKTTEASTFHSIAVLDDPADSKETVVKALNILHDRFQIGNKLQYLDVVGDGKSYDHLIKLKAEYGEYGNTDMQKYITCFLINSTELSAKQMHGRKRMNLKTFAPMRISMHKQKKEIKDNQTVISCLRKQIAFSKHTQKPVTDLGQFISLPRAISDASGQPLKGIKSNALKVIKSTYEATFLSSLPVIDDSVQSNLILEGMFLINTIPLSSHRTFSDYAEFMFNRWIVKSHIQFKAQEIHVVFDHPNRNEKNIKTVSSHVLLPNNWRNFINVRDHKRKLVNYLSYQFITLSLQRFQNHECVVTTGGFDDVNVDKVLSSLGGVDGSIVECCNLNSTYEEGDKRVWLHAIQSKSQRIIIYSPDTDTFFVGLPFIDSISCKCVNCVNLTTNLNQAVDDPDSDLGDSEQEEDISYESDSETDINEFAADTSGNTSTAYINYRDTFENYIFALPTD